MFSAEEEEERLRAFPEIGLDNVAAARPLYELALAIREQMLPDGDPIGYGDGAQLRRWRSAASRATRKGRVERAA